jgi:hypothetical protein
MAHCWRLGGLLAEMKWLIDEDEVAHCLKYGGSLVSTSDLGNSPAGFEFNISYLQ